MLSRRGFLQTMIGSVVAGAAVRTFPFRVFSFPEQIIIPKVQGQSIRFICAFDIERGKMINRWDVLMGWPEVNKDRLPRGVEQAVLVRDVKSLPEFAKPHSGIDLSTLNVNENISLWEDVPPAWTQ